MNSIFWELLHEGVLANYIDDFVIPAKFKKELEERTIFFLKIVENITYVSNGQNTIFILKKF